MPQPTAADDGRWIAAGSVAPNETYVGQRLMYQRFADVEHGLADMVNRTMASRILRRTFYGDAAITVFVAVLAVGASANGTPSRLVPVWFVLVALWTTASMLVPVVDTLSQWHLLLDGKAALAESAYAVVLRSLRDNHQVPAGNEVSRLRVGPPIPGIRNFLLIRLGTYQVYVSVFAFGRDLYLGWTLRQRQASARVLARLVASWFRPDRRFDDLIDVEPVMALRDAVHNALRESIETAATNQRITIPDALGHQINVTDYVGERQSRLDWSNS